MNPSTVINSPFSAEKKKNESPIVQFFGFTKRVGDQLGETVSATTFNMLNSVLGCGILFLPMVLSKMGVVIGLIFIVVGGGIMNIFALLGYYALRSSIKKHGNIFPTIESFALHTFGKVAYYVIKITFMLNMVSFLMGYGIVLVETMLSVLNIETDDPRRFIIGGVIFFFENLICMVDKIRDFKLISYVSCVFDFVFIFVAFYLYLSGEVVPVGSVKIWPNELNFWTVYDSFSVFGLVVFSYWNLLFYSSQQETKANEQYKVKYSIILSGAIVMVINTTVALVGYLSFLGDTEANVILNYEKGLASVVLRILIFMPIFLTYPLYNYLSAIAFDEVILFFWNKCCSNDKAEMNSRRQLRRKTKQLRMNDNEKEESSDFSSDDFAKDACIPTEKPISSFNILPSFLVRGVKKCVSVKEEELGLLKNEESNKFPMENKSSEEDSGEDIEYMVSDEEESDEEVEKELRKNLRTKKSNEMDREKENSNSSSDKSDGDFTKGDNFNKHKVKADEEPTTKQRVIRFFRLAVINTMCSVMIYLVVMFYPESGKVISFVGASFGTLIGIVFPAICYLKVIEMGKAWKIIVINITLVATLIFGIIPTGIAIVDLFITRNSPSE